MYIHMDDCIKHLPLLLCFLCFRILLRLASETTVRRPETSVENVAARISHRHRTWCLIAKPQNWCPLHYWLLCIACRARALNLGKSTSAQIVNDPTATLDFNWIERLGESVYRRDWSHRNLLGRNKQRLDVPLFVGGPLVLRMLVDWHMVNHFDLYVVPCSLSDRFFADVHLPSKRVPSYKPWRSTFAHHTKLLAKRFKMLEDVLLRTLVFLFVD